MIKVNKDFINIPKILTSKNREEAFNNNIKAKKFEYGKTLYKVVSVQKELKKIYHDKCAYCEQKLLDAPKHIEHYRPKDKYYWLAYSWDNLLLACHNCNTNKSNKFKIKYDKVNYNNENFKNIHNLSNSYNKKEQPYIINPEKDDIKKEIIFDNNGKISSKDERVTYTIEECCKLNRDELLQKRIKILNNFKHRLEEHYFYFRKYGDISRFIPDIKDFISKCKVENEFYAFRSFILANIDIMFENKNLQVIINKIQEGSNENFK